MKDLDFFSLSINLVMSFGRDLLFKLSLSSNARLRCCIGCFRNVAVVQTFGKSQQFGVWSMPKNSTCTCKVLGVRKSEQVGANIRSKGFHRDIIC